MKIKQLLLVVILLAAAITSQAADWHRLEDNE